MDIAYATWNGAPANINNHYCHWIPGNLRPDAEKEISHAYLVYWSKCYWWRYSACASAATKYIMSWKYHFFALIGKIPCNRTEPYHSMQKKGAIDIPISVVLSPTTSRIPWFEFGIELCILDCRICYFIVKCVIESSCGTNVSDSDAQCILSSRWYRRLSARLQ